jgi:hypothetical protein
MTSLTSRAMLVNFTVCSWQARKHDKKVSDKVAADHGAQLDAGRYNKVLIARSALKALGAVQGAARDHHYKNTLPWADWGPRILPAANYWPYMEKQRGLKADFDKAATEFIGSYATYVEEAKARLNGMFDAADYPTLGALRDKFQYRIEVTPLPGAEDFRVSLGDDEQGRVRADIEERVKDATGRAIRDLWDRVHEAVEHMHDRLHNYDVDESGKVVGGIFRDSMVTNLRELVELLPRLNVTGDADLEAMRKRLTEKLCAADPQTLRDDPKVRYKAKKSAEQILKDMAGYISA